MRILLCLLLTALSGCPKPEQPPEKCEALPVELNLVADAQLNLNAAGQPAPVEVRVLLLAEREVFDQLDFQTIWREGEKELGKALVKQMSLIVYPGEDKIAAVKSPLEVGYVALVPLFRQPDEGGEWRQVVDIRAAAKRCRPGGLHIPVRARLRDNRIMKLDSAAGR